MKRILEQDRWIPQWLANALREHSAVSDVRVVDTQLQVDMKGRSRAVKIVGVALPQLGVPDLTGILEEAPGVDAIVNVRRTDHYLGAAKDAATRMGIGLVTMKELMSGIDFNLVGFQVKHVTYVRTNVLKHDRVERTEMVCEEIVRIHRVNMHPVDVVIASEYTIEETAIENILNRHRRILAIINNHPYGQFTGDAYDLSTKYGVALFAYKELLGALNYEGNAFRDYTPPVRG